MKTMRVLVFFEATLIAGLSCVPTAQARPEVLSGVVSSAEEASMEGVLVSAKRESGNMTVTVFSDAQGRYTFPENRLTPGKYHLSVRAAGYDLEDPGLIEIQPGKAVQVDLKLRKTKDLAAQLSNAEWFMSISGTDEQKKALGQCTICHSATRIVQSHFNAEEWVGILNKMRGFNDASTPMFPIKNPEGGELRRDYSQLAQYLASINLSSSQDGKWKYELKTLPRPKGKATRVIVTEYDLPRPNTVPHDAAADPHGMVWYTDHAHGYLGRLDPKTGGFKEWRVPIAKQGAMEGGVDISFDSGDSPWFTMFRQAAIARFDRKTEKIGFWKVPEKYNDAHVAVGMLAPSPDGSVVWFKGGGNSKGAQEDLKTGKLGKMATPEFVSAYSIGTSEREYLHKLDVKSGNIVSYPVPASIYGISAASDGSVAFTAINQGYIGVIDAKSGELRKYPTPTPNSGPRRGHVDARDRFWFGEYWANKIGMLDLRSKEFKEWTPSTPWSQPYDAVGDKRGEVWAGGMNTDYIYRLNPETGEVVEYLLPALNANVRRIDVDNSSSRVSCWVGEDHHAKLARIEPLE